jgi:hypothetical protein
MEEPFLSINRITWNGSNSIILSDSDRYTSWILAKFLKSVIFTLLFKEKDIEKKKPKRKILILHAISQIS